MEILNDLYKLCDTLGKSLKEANEKITSAGGKLSPSDMEYINKLTHSLKSVKACIAMIEAEEEGGSSYDGGGSYEGGSYRGGYSREGNSYRGGSYEGGSYDGGSYDNASYARGRGRNARRDSMGRYSRRGYSREGGYSREEGYSRASEGMAEELRGLMEQAPNDQIRQEMQRLIQKIEQQ